MQQADELLDHEEIGQAHKHAFVPPTMDCNIDVPQPARGAEPDGVTPIICLAWQGHMVGGYSPWSS